MSNDRVTQNSAVLQEQTYNSNNIREAFKDCVDKPIWAASNKEKIPINPKTGLKAKINDASTWGTYDEVEHFSSTHPGHLPAIALSESLGITVIDLDHVRDPSNGNILTHAQEIIKQASSYTEISRSGKGLHIFIRGNKPEGGNKQGNVEIYDAKKFMTLTGYIFDNLKIVERAQERLNIIYEGTIQTKKTEERTEPLQNSPPLSDEQILTLCRNAKNSNKFTSLYEKGEHSGDASAADMALCVLLAFYTQDTVQIERLLRKSALKRDKWDTHPTYLSTSIQKALVSLKATYLSQSTTQISTDITTILEKYPLIPDTPFPLQTLPICLRDAVLEVSRVNKVDPSLAALPGIGMAALQIGKKAVIEEKPGLRHHASIFLCGVAESGERKSSTFDRMTEGLKAEMEKAENQYRAECAQIQIHNGAIADKIKDAKKALAKLEDLEGKEARDLVDKVGELTRIIRHDVAEPQNYFDDITPQRIFQKLHVHRGAFGIVSSEGRGILHRIMGKGSNDGSTQESIFLSGMWGDDISRSRVGNNKGESGGEDIIIRKPALTTVCLVQPDVWQEICKDERLRESGFISRVQVVMIPSTIGSRIEEKDEEKCNASKLERYNQAIISLWKWKREHPLVVSLDEQAKERRRLFHNMIEQELQIGCDLEDVRDIASKAVSLTCRLALIFTLVRIADERPHKLHSNQEILVSEDDWLNAQELQEYFLGQAIISRRESSKHGKTHKLIRAINWVKKHRDKGAAFTIRDIVRGLSKGTTSEEAEGLCIEMIQRGFISLDKSEKMSRTKHYLSEMDRLP